MFYIFSINNYNINSKEKSEFTYKLLALSWINTPLNILSFTKAVFIAEPALDESYVFLSGWPYITAVQQLRKIQKTKHQKPHKKS